MLSSLKTTAIMSFLFLLGAITNQIFEEKPQIVQTINEALLERDSNAASVTVETNQGSGSGVIIGHNNSLYYIITCAHVVRRSYNNGLSLQRTTSDISIEQISYTGKTELSLPVKIVLYDEYRDVALLEAYSKKKPLHINKFASLKEWRTIKYATRVYAIGSPMDVYGVITHGIVSHLDQHNIISSTPIFFGNSGGGLFLQKSGHLIGLNQKGRGIGSTIAPNISYAIDLPTILLFLKTRGYGWLIK